MRLCKMAQMDRHVLKLWSSRRNFASMKLPPWSCALMLKYGINVTTPTRYPRKRFCILTERRRHYTGHYLLLHNVTVEPNHRHTTPRIWSWLSVTRGIVSFTVLLHACIQFETIFTKYLPLTTPFELSDGDFKTRDVFKKNCQSPPSRLKTHGTAYLCHDMRLRTVVTTNFTTKRIADVHRFVLTTQTTTVNCIPIIVSIYRARLPVCTSGTAWVMCWHFPPIRRKNSSWDPTTVVSRWWLDPTRITTMHHTSVVEEDPRKRRCPTVPIKDKNGKSGYVSLVATRHRTTWTFSSWVAQMYNSQTGKILYRLLEYSVQYQGRYMHQKRLHFHQAFGKLETKHL